MSKTFIFNNDDYRQEMDELRKRYCRFSGKEREDAGEVVASVCWFRLPENGKHPQEETLCQVARDFLRDFLAFADKYRNEMREECAKHDKENGIKDNDLGMFDDVQRFRAYLLACVLL